MSSRWPRQASRVRALPVDRKPADQVAMKLSELGPGDSAVLRQLPMSGTAFLRLREMGLLPGTRVRLVRRAPLGDPLEIEVRGYHLSLRREEAERVDVEPAVPCGPKAEP